MSLYCHQLSHSCWCQLCHSLTRANSRKKWNIDHQSKIDEFVLGTKEKTVMVKDLFYTVNHALRKSNGESPQKKK
jgi:hypothetical protein